MFSTLRNRFGIPGVISVIALVFAMLGGAYAASNNGSDNGATASAKKKAAKGPRGPRGATGPAGPAGTAGPAGPKGDTGAAGANGSNGATGATGATGASVTSTAIDPGEFECDELGGTEFKVGSGSPTFACNGENGEKGEPWTAGGTLPSGETETGTWAATVLEAEPTFHLGLAPISFPIPLADPLDASHVKLATANPPVVPAECEDSTHDGTAKASNPEAQPGFLCVYVQTFLESTGEVSSIQKPSGSGVGADVSGAFLEIFSEKPFNAVFGTFAVTAPTS